MVTRAYHHGNLREALLDGAERALVDQGLVTVSLRELAREIGVSHAAPRRHFAGRQELLDGLAVRGFAQLEASLAGAVDGVDSFDDRVTASARAYVDFAVERGELLDLMFVSKHRPGADAVVAAGHRAFEPLLALVREGQALGVVAPGDPETASVPLVVAVHGLATMLKGAMLTGDRDTLVAQVVGAALRGVRP